MPNALRQVLDCNIIADRVTGQPRGFGFVKFFHEEAAAAAVERLHNYTLAGRRLLVRPKGAARDRGDRGGLPPPPPLGGAGSLPPPPPGRPSEWGVGSGARVQGLERASHVSRRSRCSPRSVVSGRD